MFDYSMQQRAFFHWGRTGNPAGGLRTPHLVGRARAGTGKTTTLEEMIRHMAERRILVTAYNKRIIEAFKERKTRADARTQHSLGLMQVRRQWKVAPVNFGGDRARALTEAVCGRRCPDPIQTLVNTLHTKAREMAPHSRDPGSLIDIMDQFELLPEQEFIDAGFDDAYIEARALEAMDIAARTEPVDTGIDGADMIFLPLRNHWVIPTFDGGLIDEAQDMTEAQLEMTLAAVRGRLAIVGDDRQAIYGFRGADSGALDRLKRELQAAELPLTVTYRCAQRIVELARQIVPDFQAGPDNPDGTISYLDGKAELVKAAGPGDFILSRLNAPLGGVAMACLRAGKRTKIAGKNIGDGLSTIIKKLRTFDIIPFLEKLRVYQVRETERLMAAGRESKVELLRDKCSMLVELSEDLSNTDELQARIDSLFTDNGLGDAGFITCSSVHKAKGLEANRVFILTDTLRDHNQEELNIRYVAITRAKSELVWVGGIK